MLNRILKSIIFTLLPLSLSSISYANDVEPREADQAVTVNIYNYSGKNLSLVWSNLIWGRWGATPEYVINTMDKSRYSIKGKATSGPEANVVYNIPNDNVKLEIYANSNHFSPSTFDSFVCLKTSGSSDCRKKIGDYEVMKVERPKADGKVLHHLDVYIKNTKYLPFESLCSGYIDDNKLIGGVIATDGKELNIQKNEYDRFYGAGNKIMNVARKNNSQDVVALDLIKTAYLTGMKVNYCSSSLHKDNLETLIIHK